MSKLQEDYIYRLKVLVLGDKGVGKTSLILTYLHGRPPNILPPNENLCFYTKQQDYECPPTKEKDQDVDVIPHYECRFHIWDISGSACNHQTLLHFKQQKFYETTAALIYVFKDESSFQFLKKLVTSGIQKEITSKQQQYIIYNPFRDSLSQSLEEKAKAFATNEYKYLKLQPSDVPGVKKLFKTILDQFMSKVSKDTITNGILRDRDNSVVLRGRRNKYNHCC